MFVVAYQVHGAVDIRTILFSSELTVHDWVARNQEEFSFIHVSNVI